MQAVVKKWENSLALRLPQHVAADMRIVEGTSVSMTVEGETLVVKPMRKRYRLPELLAGVTPEHRRSEVDWGTPEGEEVL